MLESKWLSRITENLNTKASTKTPIYYSVPNKAPTSPINIKNVYYDRYVVIELKFPPKKMVLILSANYGETAMGLPLYFIVSLSISTL